MILISCPLLISGINTCSKFFKYGAKVLEGMGAHNANVHGLQRLAPAFAN